MLFGERSCVCYLRAVDVKRQTQVFHDVGLSGAHYVNASHSI